MAFRTDASLEIGNGHMMRCLTLADVLGKHGARCSFICRPHQGHLLALVEQRGHHVLPLPALEISSKPNFNDKSHTHLLGTGWALDAQDTQQAMSFQTGGKLVDWLVVDHYALSALWEDAMRPVAKRIMVIDDLADRPHTCDLLLDQNLGRKVEHYSNLLKGNPTILIGPQYALLRPEFISLREQSLARRKASPKLRHLLITMGGVDKNNATSQVLRSLQRCGLPRNVEITVIMGPHAPWLDEVRVLAAQMPWHIQVLVGVSNIAELMVDSDLAIGAAGSTSWELCCLGVPTLLIATAVNQRTVIEALVSTNAAVGIDYTELSQPDGISFCSQFTLITENLATYAAAAARITDGRGASRVYNELYESN